MDHAIDALYVYVDIEAEFFAEEWKSGNYKKFSDCPSYDSAKALVDATNIMRKHMGWTTLILKDFIVDK